MADIEVQSTCEEGYTVESVINGDWELVIDALNNDGPNPNEVLVADYISCYIPALRVAAGQHDYDDIAEVEAEVTADLDEDDDLEAVGFRVEIEADLGDDEQAIAELGEEICHVHSALTEELHADVSIESGV